MCLIAFAYKAHPKFKFILTANRDEFYDRPTAVTQWWEDHPEILGGRDLQALGTWMAIHKNGRFAAVTNYRDIKSIKTDVRSRGDLPVNFLLSEDKPSKYSSAIARDGDQYNGFNLLTLDEELAHVSNYSQGVNMLEPGIYGLSNALLDTPWPKVQQAKSDLNGLIKQAFSLKDLISILQNTDVAADDDLPETGLDYVREKALSAMCIRTSGYGTCCSTAITIDYEGQVSFMEKSYAVGDRIDGVVSFQFQIEKGDDARSL